jgi:ribosomal protein L24E
VNYTACGLNPSQNHSHIPLQKPPDKIRWTDKYFIFVLSEFKSVNQI